MFTMIAENSYKKECSEGTQICLACGQWNSKERHSCSYCCGSSKWLASFSEAGCIRPTSELPLNYEGDTENKLELDSIRVESMKEFREWLGTIKSWASNQKEIKC